MPNRILKDSICTSPNVDRLSRDAEVFFYRLIVQCDDFGRMDARLPILRAKCYPLQIVKVSEGDIAAWLHELETSKLVTVYSVGDQDYLQMCTWDKHQQVRARRSKYPSPPTVDSNGNHLIASDSKCTRNPIQLESESESNPIVNATHQDMMKGQYEAVLGMVPTASYPEMTGYMDKLQSRGVAEWWALALTETVDHANRPTWQYMKSILESWLAAGKPSASKNGKDPAKKREPEPGRATWMTGTIDGSALFDAMDAADAAKEQHA